MRIAVTVCTRERPELLRACMDSLLSQEIPAGLSLSIVIVENDEIARCAGMVSELARTSHIPIHYAHESRLGIPIARNRALSLALKQQPDWIAFIDDDETAAPNWLVNFHYVARSLTCDVLQGPVEPVYSNAPPSWLPVERRKCQPTGRKLRTAATSNTFMRAHLAAESGLNLRFDERMRFTGGSDNDYFYRAAALGARICWSNETLVYERVPQVRMTLRWQLARSMRVAANTVAMQKLRSGPLSAAAKYAPKYAGRLVWGLLMTPLSAPAAMLGGPGQRLLVSRLQDLASACGGIGAFFGFQPQPYSVIDRHPPLWTTTDSPGSGVPSASRQ